MSAILLIIFIILFFASPVFRCAVTHIHRVIFYAVRDLRLYFIQHKADLCPTGDLLAYTGLFGKGKTLSAVHKVTSMYRRYDGKKVWCGRREKFVTQRVQILSNVDLLTVPYERLESLSQVIWRAENNVAIDDVNDTLTVTLVLGDEFSVQLNSRSFKTNIDPLFLNTLLTSRHYHISIFYTTQRFKLVDALLRQVTSYVVDCNKLWRFQAQAIYDAWDLENASNVQLIKPLSRRCWFVENKDYAAYDTLACVDDLKKSVKDGDMLSSEEILALQCNQVVNVDAITRPSGKLRKLWKNKNK